MKADKTYGVPKMKIHESINIISKVARNYMKVTDVSRYIGDVVTFCMYRLQEDNAFTAENLEKMLADEAEFHLRSQSKDVA